MAAVFDLAGRMDATVSPDVLERLHDQRAQIDELFDGFAQSDAGAQVQPLDAGRIATLIYTLLRVHAALEAEVLVPAIQWAGGHRLLHIATLRRTATLEQVDRAEAMAPGGEAHGREMLALRQVSRAWFDYEEGPVFRLARRLRLDLHRLDRTMARRQERLLTVGPLF
jgi:hypothetical protein